MVTLYWILKYLTFPGALLKSFLEHLFCRIYKVPIEFALYMQRNSLCGHMEHLLVKEKKGSFGICFGPHIIMLVLGLLVSFPAGVQLFYLGGINIYALICLYFGLSFLHNAFPLLEDAYSMWDHLYGSEADATTAGKILCFIPACVMFAGAWLEQYSLTLLTGLGATAALPYFVSLFFGIGLS